MPVDRDHSRFSRQGTLGTAAIWKCPACGAQNEGRSIEQGCGQCGSGDPLKSRAGQPGGASREEVAHDPVAQRQAAPAIADAPPRPTRRPEAGPVRILRLIEYLIAPGENADEVLRRSLVGTLHFRWGQLTGTIVDSCDGNQEDRLRLAKLQPGVWLGNGTVSRGDIGRTPTAREIGDAILDTQIRRPQPVENLSTRAREEDVTAYTVPRSARLGPRVVETVPGQGTLISQEIRMESDTIRDVAGALLTSGGYRLAYTLLLALQAVLPELPHVGTPEQVWTTEEAEQLMAALQAQLPEGWGDPEAPPAPATDPDRQAVQERIAGIQGGSQPTATPWQEPKGKTILEQ